MRENDRVFYLSRMREAMRSLYFRFDHLSNDEIDELIKEVDECVSELKKIVKAKKDQVNG